MKIITGTVIFSKYCYCPGGGDGDDEDPPPKKTN